MIFDPCIILWYDKRKRGDHMDIGELAIGMSQVQTANSIGVAVLAKGLEMMEVTGQGLVEMLDLAAVEHEFYPELGGNIDVTV